MPLYPASYLVFRVLPAGDAATMAMERMVDVSGVCGIIRGNNGKSGPDTGFLPGTAAGNAGSY